jgi:hypothetical protein
MAPIATFSYKNIKSTFLFGYKIVEWPEGFFYKIADQEKALLDFLYLKPNYKSEQDFESLRLNLYELEQILFSVKMKDYLDYIDSKTLKSKINLLKNLTHA